MNKRRIIAVFIAFVLTIAATAMWSASTDEREGDPDAIVLEDSGSEAGATQPKKGGNKVVKVITAPFKAFGRLFGRGKDDDKLQRMTEKDAERFASVGVTKIEDANNRRAKRKSPSLVPRANTWKPDARRCWPNVTTKPSPSSLPLLRSIQS